MSHPRTLATLLGSLFLAGTFASADETIYIEAEPATLPQSVCTSCESGCDSKLAPHQVNDLLILLNDRYFETRRGAALKLGHANLECNPEVEAALVNSLLSDCEKLVRLAAAKSLKHLRAHSPSTLMALRSARDHDRFIPVRCMAKLALAKAPSCNDNGLTAGATCAQTKPQSAAVRQYPKPFIVGWTRYEPKLRDIRDVPNNPMAPGDGFYGNTPETLPVIPPYQYGYFRTAVLPLP